MHFVYFIASFIYVIPIIDILLVKKNVSMYQKQIQIFFSISDFNLTTPKLKSPS